MRLIFRWVIKSLITIIGSEVSLKSDYFDTQTQGYTRSGGYKS